MKTEPTPLTFDNVDAIDHGGSYIVGADGKAVRDDQNSTSQEALPKGAPGQVAETSATDGVAPARLRTSTSPGAKP